MHAARTAPRALALGIALLLVACAGVPPTGSPTPAIVPIISTPFPAYAAATPAARLHDRPGGAAGPTLPRGANLQVEAITAAADGQFWYRVTTADGVSGWLPAAALSLVDDPVAIMPTRPPVTIVAVTRVPVTPTPRPLVIAGSGQGLFLRAEPGQGGIITSYPDGTRVIPLGGETRLDGRRWLQVRAPDGREGWMAAEYLRAGP